MTVLNELSSMPDDFAALFKKFPRELHDWVPSSWHGIPGEKFSALGQACHLRDIEVDGYHDRFAKTLHEECPTLASLDGYMLAQERQYSASDADEVMDCFRGLRMQTVELLKKVSEADWQRRAVFGGYGEISLGSLVHLLRSHDLQHLACMHWLLARIQAR
ncbi:MAG TPA: DinB family protein [Noviherbaspirillum sp.]|nr:DinB family protein [Noviherbaspirillum sp.]